MNSPWKPIKLNYYQTWKSTFWFQLLFLLGSWAFLSLSFSYFIVSYSTSQSWRKSTLIIHWKDWCWSWASNNLTTWCKEATHWKRLWGWERLRAGGEVVTEDKMVGCHPRLNGHEYEQSPRDSEGQGSLVYCSPWDCRLRNSWETEQRQQFSSDVPFLSTFPKSTRTAPSHLDLVVFEDIAKGVLIFST